MKATLLLSSCALALATSHVQAQRYHVSPTVAATAEGSGSNAFPFTSTTQRRYQQIHSDLPKTSMRITAIGFRHGQSRTNITYTGSRMLDMEMVMGRSVAWNQASFIFDNNFVQSSKTKVIARKMINMKGATATNPGPSPFSPNLELKLDTPYVYVPVTGSIAWEITMYANSSTGSFGTLDADSSSGTLGSDVAYGTGCTATGRSSAVTHTTEIADRAGTLMMLFSARNCPANAPALLVLGSRRLGITIPGLCSQL